MRKELRPVHDNVACDVCGRTILKGERTESYLAPGGERHTVCDLCFTRAEHHGWIRESAADDMPTRFPRPEPRRPLLKRLFRRPARRAAPRAANGPSHGPEGGANPGSLEANGDEGATEAPAYDLLPLDPEHEPLPPPPPVPRVRAADGRHVRAVPTTAEVKVERALELFNASEHQRTVAGLVRTLGMPWITAAPDPEAPSMVNVVVAWELSWYRYRVDLGDEADPIALLEKGEELREIERSLREWNATIDADGRLVAEVGSRG